jgi:hypothetical protein
MSAILFPPPSFPLLVIGANQQPRAHHLLEEVFFFFFSNLNSCVGGKRVEQHKTNVVNIERHVFPKFLWLLSL